MKPFPAPVLIPGLLFGLLLGAGSPVASGQTVPAPQPPPEAPRPQRDGEGPPPPRRVERGDRTEGMGDRRGGPSGGFFGGHGGRPPMMEHGFEKLSDEQKQRVRAALGKAWSRPEVSAARDRVMRANEELKRELNKALEEIDPDSAALVASLRPPGGDGHGGRLGPPVLPPPESPDFPDAALRRLELELVTFTSPERRDEMRRLHQKLVGEEPVSEAVRDLRAAPPDRRPRAMEHLRRVYRARLDEVFKARREARERGEAREPGPQ